MTTTFSCFGETVLFSTDKESTIEVKSPVTERVALLLHPPCTGIVKVIVSTLHLTDMQG